MLTPRERLSLIMAVLPAFALISTMRCLRVYLHPWDSESVTTAAPLPKVGNTRCGLTRTGQQPILVENTPHYQYSYGYAILLDTVPQTHAHHPGHPARMARGPQRPCEYRAAIPAVDRPVQTVLQRARP